MAYRVQRFRQTKSRPGDTSAYAAGDVISENASNTVGTAWSFPQLRQSAGEIRGARLYTNSEVTGRHRLHLFASNPANSELDDNAQFGELYADELLKIGEIDFPALASSNTTVGDAARSQNFDLRIPIRQVSLSNSEATDIYGVLVTLDAYTPGSGSAYTIDLFVGSGE